MSSQGTFRGATARAEEMSQARGRTVYLAGCIVKTSRPGSMINQRSGAVSFWCCAGPVPAQIRLA